MRISDWSSDVCSSDLSVPVGNGARQFRFLPALPADRWLSLGYASPGRRFGGRCGCSVLVAYVILGVLGASIQIVALPLLAELHKSAEIGRASCRERVCQYV